MLREAVTALPSVTFAAGWSLRSLTEHVDAVVVEVAGPDDASGEVVADHVVGCDGGASTTREMLGARLLGRADSSTNLTIVFRAPGLAERVPHGPAVHYWIRTAGVMGVLGRFDLADTWWAGVGGVDPAAVDPAAVIRQLVGGPVECEILCTDPWQARMQLADRFQSGRVHLAGDAAHLNPPWGGHGFNTGVGDAVNIGWKLAATLQGWGGPNLLASYGRERRTIAETTLAHTTRTMLATRDLHPGHDPAEAIQRRMHGEFHSLGLVLGYAYPHSPVVVPDSDAPPDGVLSVYTPSIRPGARLPHVWLPDGRSLYDILAAGMTLLRRDGHGDALVLAAQRRAIPLAVADLPADHAYRDAAAVLVRPDQHIAWRSCGADLTGDAAADILDRVLGHQQVTTWPLRGSARPPTRSSHT